MTNQLAYSKAQAAAAAGVSIPTLDRAIKSGRLRAKRTSVSSDGEPAGSVLVLASSLETWLEGLVDA